MRDKRQLLIACYNASFGGKYELTGQIDNLDELIQNGFVKATQCRKDPLSTHGAKTCRVILVRMTKKGISEAHQIAGDRLKVIRIFLKSLDSLPPRIKSPYKFLLKKWLKACENRRNFTWDVRKGSTFLPLPQVVKQSITETNEDLVEMGLAACASLHHNTSGPSDQTLVTCPEILDYFLSPSAAVRNVTLDEYLRYLLNGLSLVKAQYRLLHILSDNRKILRPWLEHLSQEEGIYAETLLSWVKEIEDCGYCKAESTEEDVVAYGDPWNFFLNPREDIRRIQTEVKNDLERWFETGEEAFQRFELRH